MDHIQHRSVEKIVKMLERGLDPNFHDLDTGGGSWVGEDSGKPRGSTGSVQKCASVIRPHTYVQHLPFYWVFENTFLLPCEFWMRRAEVCSQHGAWHTVGAHVLLWVSEGMKGGW